MAVGDNKPPSRGIEFYGGYQVYSDSGVDLTLLRRNLELSRDQRWQNNSRSLALVRAFAASAKPRLTSAWREVDHPMIDAAPILRQLHAHAVDFVVVGGLAMLSHGSAYVTEGMDICYRRTPQNFQALQAAFAPFHPYLRGAPAGLNFTLTSDHGDVDLLGELSGVGNYDKVLAGSEEHVVFGMTVRVLSLDGLIAAKRAAGRPKGIAHLLELEELKKLRDAAEGESHHDIL